MPAATPLPADIRAMNHVSTALFAIAAVTLMVAATVAIVRMPAFAIQGIRIDGDIVRANVAAIRSNAASKLVGSFFTLDLDEARQAFESVPWVRRAVITRVWPNRLTVRLQEHRAVALWGDDRLVNSYGEVFDANLGDVEDEGLPVFVGPKDKSSAVLSMYTKLAPLFVDALVARTTRLTLSGNGSWRIELDSGAELELGRGSDAEVQQRTERFLRTLAQVTQQYQRPLVAADLRYADGYAVRLQGITTGVADKKR